MVPAAALAQSDAIRRRPTSRPRTRTRPSPIRSATPRRAPRPRPLRPQPGATAPADPAAPPVPGTTGPMVPTPGIGVPDGRMGLQDQVTPIGREAAGFHDNWLLTLCVDHQRVRARRCCCGRMIRYNRRANPTPSRNSHNTLARSGVDAASGADPGRHRDSLDPAHRPPILAAQGRCDDQGHRPPMVLDLRISRPWA